MRIFGYIRFSSTNQIGNTTVETQRECIQRFVEAMPELRERPIVECRDEAKSGTTLVGRDGLASIMRDATKGDAVVVFKYDRLGRNLLDALQTIKQLEEHGIQVYSTSEPNNEVVRNLLLTMAQEFSRQLGQRCKIALDSLARSGHVTNKAPYGYSIHRDGPKARGRLVQVPEQAAVVRGIFEMRADGFSHREIVQNLNRERIPSPRGVQWLVSCIFAFLKNETYLGRSISGMRIIKKGKGLVGKRQRKEWSICENAHEPIVDLKLWDAVRERDSKKQNGHVTTHKSRSHYLLTGFLKCAHCGANLVRYNSKGQVYYGCESGRKRGINLPCHRRYLVREGMAIELIVKVLVEKVYGPAVIRGLLGLMKEEIHRVRKSADEVIKPLQTTMDRLNRQIETAARRMVNMADMSDDVLRTFKDEIKKLEAERDEIRAQIESARAIAGGEVKLDDLERRMQDALEHLGDAIRDADVLKAREALGLHVERIEVTSDKKARLIPKPGLLDVALGGGPVGIPSRI